MTELYKKYRPTKLAEVRGQDATVRILDKFSKNGGVPHALLLSGPAGCGKTTLARIMARRVGAKGSDVIEVNSADFRGIDDVRAIRARIQLAPAFGRARVWIIDECHQSTSDAQNAMLKMLEDTPSHVWFMLATTDAQKLLPTIRSRCTEVVLKSLDAKELGTLVTEVLAAEKRQLPEAVTDAIVDTADGGARKALVLLEQALAAPDNEDTQLAAVMTADSAKDAIILARVLISHKGSWTEAAAVLKGISNDNAEDVRHLILAYATTVLLGQKRKSPIAERAVAILDEFSETFFHNRRAGLVNACFSVIVGS